jgi:hypothetical protein
MGRAELIRGGIVGARFVRFDRGMCSCFAPWSGWQKVMDGDAKVEVE